MGGWLALIPLKVRLAFFGAFVFGMALIGIRIAIRQEAFREVENRNLKRRLKTVLESERIEDEVDEMDRDALVRAASEWVRRY